MAEQSFNIPQVIAVLLVGFLAIRWFLSSSNHQGSGSRGAGRQIDPAHVEQIHQMFPQLDRRTIMWDLQRNGGSVQATTERVLSGRTLAQPPPSFRPQLPTSPAPTAASGSRQADAKAPLPDLITRFNLSSKLNVASDAQPSQADSATATPSKQSGWSQNKTERSELMRKRKEEMILAARRKMEDKDRTTSGAS
ncbi:hypothetical protein K461DRAFT_281206 [Myriangium duriaei CBS 260.36]|uniref:Coupling of ubiquitin conjugation to ER degradation protein 1 n=1 Tax=Myriangium duriaei CBS 260.36 TaxID=1168546 RepID=A0A9P4IY33_9PEZI|nr:hypothetical protein K461DRAFT_281206 [Myriangium duriaei CBS 260.36]